MRRRLPWRRGIPPAPPRTEPPPPTASSPEAPTPAGAGAGPGTRAHDGSDDRPTELERFTAWLDERTGLAGLGRATLRKVFPDHWSFLVGEIALFMFVILVATGVFLTFFYVPSSAHVIYEGPYEPLIGQEVTAAYASVLNISLEVRAGLLMRQIHHWAAVIFVAVVVFHLARVFFTGAFRRPREVNWVIGFTLLVLAMGLGFTGYSLPDDLLSGTGARIAYSAAISIPLIGPYLGSLVFGGEFPTEAFIPRFFVLHVLILPALFVGAVSAHLALVFIQKHTQYRGGRARQDNVVGRYLWPGQTFLSVGLFFLTAAVLAGIGGLIQINPVWLWGPFDPASVSSPAQPDWYVGWLDGALRIFPPFEPVIFGFTIPSAFIPGVLIPGIAMTIVALWPWIEARVTGDRRPHHLLDWPWEQPFRAASGAAILTFFAVLTLAGGNDVLAVYLDVEVELLTRIFQLLTVGLPIVVWLLTYRLCHARLARPAPEVLAAEAEARAAAAGLPGPRRGGMVVRRTATGGFEEMDE
jgi:ubiquinol-cytochrome c reductase cytochrome b subunit